MKTMLDKNGNFMFTFEGDTVDLSDPAYILSLIHI